MDPEAVFPDRHREDLDRHAFLRGITRLLTSRAAGTLRFSVQTAGDGGPAHPPRGRCV